MTHPLQAAHDMIEAQLRHGMEAISAEAKRAPSTTLSRPHGTDRSDLATMVAAAEQLYAVLDDIKREMAK
jgi:hypothetical protein